MSLATRFQGTAARLIAKHGADITVTARAATPVQDVTKPWRGSTGTQTVIVKAVRYDYKEEEAKDVYWRRSHTRFLVSENDTAGNGQFNTVDLTTATDLTDTDGSVWSIDDVEIIEPGNDRVAYILYATR